MGASYVPNLLAARKATESQSGGIASPAMQSREKKAKPLNPTLIQLFWTLSPAPRKCRSTGPSQSWTRDPACGQTARRHAFSKQLAIRRGKRGDLTGGQQMGESSSSRAAAPPPASRRAGPEVTSGVCAPTGEVVVRNYCPFSCSKYF